MKREDVKVPSCLTGQIVKLTQSFCMDGATHQILLPRSISFQAIYLRPINTQASSLLDHYAKVTELVSICGYFYWGPECSGIDVYYVGSTSELIERMGNLLTA